MNRALIFALLTSLVLSAYSRGQTAQPAGQSQSPISGIAGGVSLGAAAAKVADACSLAPAEWTQSKGSLIVSKFETGRQQTRLFG